MTRYQAGTYRLYVRETTEENWVELPDVYTLGREVERSANKVTTAHVGVPLHVRGPNSGYTWYDLEYWWLRITYEPPGGAESDIWYGQFADRLIKEESRALTWVALDVKQTLDRIDLGFYAYTVKHDWRDRAQQIWLRPFNEGRRDEESMLRGRRSANRYDLRPNSEDYRKQSTGEGTAYIYGRDGAWSNLEVAEYLLTASAPKGGSDQCPIGWDLDVGDAARPYLSGAVQEWSEDLLQKTTFQALRDVVLQSGPLAMVEDWSDDGTHGYKYVRLRVFVKEYEERDTSTYSIHDLLQDPENPDCDASRYRVRGQDRITNLYMYGQPARIMTTAMGHMCGTTFGDGRWGVDDWGRFPILYPAWESALEDEFDAAVKEDSEALEKYPNVYKNFTLNWTSGLETWGWPRPSGQVESDAEIGDRAVTGSQLGYPHPRRILPKNLTLQGWEYDNQDDSTALSVWSPGEEAVFDNILVWYLPPDEDPDHDEPQLLTAAGDVSEASQTGVLSMPEGLRGPDADFDLGSDAGDGNKKWEYLAVTLTVQADWRVYHHEENDDDAGDFTNVKTVHVPGQHWWAADHAIRSFDADAGAFTWVHGVLENAMPELEARGQALLKHQRAGLRYGTFKRRTVDIGYTIGDFVRKFANYDVEAPILTLRHNLRRGSATWGTKLTTGKKWSHRDST